MSERSEITLTINGQTHAIRVEPRRTLVDAIREDCGQTGTHIGCEHGVCGACTVLVDGAPVRSCLMFAVQAEGKKIRTVEGLANGEELNALQRAFMEHHGLQCGFCTPGFLMLVTGVLEREPEISDEELVDVLSSNLCRCTGYQNIVKAVRAAAGELRQRSTAISETKRRIDGAFNRKAEAKHVGQSLTRLEDRPLLTGRGRFAADISFARQLHMRIVRSNFAHGRLRSIDADAALAMPGVHAVWTAADVADIPPIDFRLTRIEGLEPYRQRLLASGFVRYVGEPVAAVFADDPYLAEDAAELVVLDVEELPVILRADAEIGEFEPGRSTEPAIVRKGYGDVDAAFRTAHAVVAAKLSIGRHSGVPLETRGAIARYDVASDMLELHGAAKVPHWNRDQLARMLGRPASSVNLYEGHVGGGFGIRGETLSGGRAGVRRRFTHAAANEMDRGPPRAPHRRQSFTRATPSRPRRHRQRRTHPRAGG